jgi:hypothetical protein
VVPEGLKKVGEDEECGNWNLESGNWNFEFETFTPLISYTFKLNTYPSTYTSKTLPPCSSSKISGLSSSSLGDYP